MDIIYDIKGTSLNKRKKVFMIIAIFIGFLLISPEEITWAKDRLNYLVYASDSMNIIQRNLSRGVVYFLSNEPLFLFVNMILSFLFSPETTLKIIIFTSVLGVLFSLGKISKYNIWVLFFFLFVPQILKNHIIHLRQGLALSFYLFGITNDGKKGKVFKYASIFIHTSFAFILLFEFLEVYFNKLRFNYTLKIIISTVCLTAFTFLIPHIAMLLGDRRAFVYSFTKLQSASGLGFLIWLLMCVFFNLNSPRDYISNIMLYGIIFYIVSYFFIDFGARIFENIIPIFMAVTVSDNRRDLRLIYILYFLIYGALQWYFSGGIYF